MRHVWESGIVALVAKKQCGDITNMLAFSVMPTRIRSDVPASIANTSCQCRSLRVFLVLYARHHLRTFFYLLVIEGQAALCFQYVGGLQSSLHPDGADAGRRDVQRYDLITTGSNSDILRWLERSTMSISFVV